MAKLLSDAWTSRFLSLSSSPNPKKAVSCNPITPPIQDKMVRETQVQVTTSVKDLAAVGVSAPPNPISNKKKRPSKETYEMDYSSSDSYSDDGGLLSERDDRPEESDDDDDDEEVVPATPNAEQPRKRAADSNDYRVRRPEPKKKKRSVSKTGRSHDDAINDLRKRLEATKNALERERSVAAAAQEEIKTLKDELEVAKSTSRKAQRYKKKSDLKTPLVKRLEKETRAFFAYDGGRKIKFLNAKHKLWSTKENTLCQMVVNALHWPAVHENNENFKRITWDNILAPLVGVMLTEHKNKIHQRMRATFNR